MEPIYLGDGVYAKPTDHDPSSITLTTGSHRDDEADNRIVLEYDVITHLLLYLERWKRTL